MSNKKKYWKGLAQLNNDPIVDQLAHNEFSEHLPVDEFLGDKNLSSTSTSRRDFLKLLGFSTAAATFSACETPIVKSIPYLVKPEEITPGVANYYATTIYDGRDYASVLVKTREGRPIKIENNKSSTSARVQASVLSLYDSSRLRNPLKKGKDIEWEVLDVEIREKLKNIKNNKIAVLTSSILSPTTKKLISDFSNEYANVEHIMIDSIPYDGILNANYTSFGVRALPKYNFDKADIIVSFGADFLGNWGSNDYAGDYIKGRNPKTGKMSKHYQIETNLSLSGSNADQRIQIKPSEQAYLLSNIYKALDGSSVDNRLEKIVKDLKQNYSRSIVISDSNDEQVQHIVNAINHKLNSYNNTIEMSSPSYLKQGDTEKFNRLIEEMENGGVGAIITYNTNPSYSFADSDRFNKALNNVDFPAFV